MKPYYVVVHDPDHKLNLIDELIADTGDATIPSRVVEVTTRDWSEHTFQALLSDNEARLLEADARVAIVEVDPTIYRNIRVIPLGSRTGIFNCSPFTTLATHRNYGLDRCTTSTNNFLHGGTYQSSNTAFNYNLDGTGVDIVVIDTGIVAGHPEFAVNADGTGGTRVVNYDWTQHGIITNVPTGGFLGDCEGHGSNCASIAAGNTCGWAPGATIYTLRAIGSGAAQEHDIQTGAILGLIDPLLAIETVQAFHLAKPITSTGYRRPTVCTNSWSYTDAYVGGRMQSVNYRGTTVSLTTTTGAGATNYGTIGYAEGGDGTFGYRYSVADAAIASCIAAGVIMVGASANNAHKIDVSSGNDYNNYILQSDQNGVPRYYHRGGTPGASTGVICVGAEDNIYGNSEGKAFFSCTGPRIDIFAPGVGVMGAYSSSSYYTAAVQDSRNSNYFLNKISGTSQATPQVSGVIACILQARPWMTATNVLKFLRAVGQKNALNENALAGNGYGFTSVGTYTNLASLQGASNILLQQPFVSPTPLQSSHK